MNELQLRTYMLTNKKMPSREDMSHWLLVLIDAFFEQGDDK